jgi:4-amino-4-deoxy-L-arabinose transferase-like glycosyltransferase
MIAAAGVPLGLALMTKPLMGFLVVPLAAGWLVWIGQARWAWKLIGAAVVAVLVAAPWHVSMIALHGREFLAQYFGAEIAERAAGRLGPASGGDKPWCSIFAQIGLGTGRGCCVSRLVWCNGRATVSRPGSAGCSGCRRSGRSAG